MKEIPDSPTLLWLPGTLDEEITSSWFARVRHEHRLPYTAILKDFKIPIAIDIDISDLSQFITKITHGVNIDENRLMKMVNLFSFSRDNSKLNFIFNRDKRLKPFVSFCPECLNESVPYWRFSWRLKFYRVCYTHNRPMRFRCQHCNGRQLCNVTNLKIPATLRKIALRFCCHCSKSLSEEKKLRAHKSEVIERHLLIEHYLSVIFTYSIFTEPLTRKNLCSSAPLLLGMFLEQNGDPHTAEYRLLRYALKNLTYKKRYLSH